MKTCSARVHSSPSSRRRNADPDRERRAAAGAARAARGNGAPECAAIGIADNDAGLGAPVDLAADQFLVARGDGMAAPTGTTVIAGYPWFGDWGRDTMIALPGLALATGRHAEAASILRTFASHLSQGMLPNRFPDGHEPPNTIRSMRRCGTSTPSQSITR